jgi:hypothetical protein
VVDAASGPFVVTLPNGGETWDLSLPQTVSWSVAGTNGAPVNAANVNILLSTDGGLTYPFLLVGGTPNDGSQAVNLACAMRSTTCRVKVEAVGNVFFDVSDADFRVADLSPPVVTPTLARAVFAPPRGSMLPAGLTSNVTDNCDPAGSLTITSAVHSDEPHGAAPFTPDALFSGGQPYLRSERDVLQDGRVYLVVVRATDTSGNAAFGCATAVVPHAATVGSYTAALVQATSAATWCNTHGGAAPATFTQLATNP